MALHVIVGAGPVGAATARLLAARGDEVRVITRRGSGPAHPRIERLAADAADAAALRQLASGAAALYNCANPAYHRWPVDWPPLAAALLAAAEVTGAVLVTTSNLYGYGPVDRPMTEDLPLAAPGAKGQVRARMWVDALAAHRAGRIRATEARASDFLGPGGDSLVSTMVLPQVLAGRRAAVPADLDAVHSFTYVGDVARTLVVLGTDERAAGQAWHVPTDRAVTIRELARRAAALAGAPAPRLVRIPSAGLWAAGLFSPTIRSFREVAYQFQRPFVVNSARFTATFGVEPTPLDEALRATLAALRGRPQASGSPSKSTIE